MSCTTCKYQYKKPTEKPCMNCRFCFRGSGINYYEKSDEQASVEYALKVLRQALEKEVFTTRISPLQALEVIEKELKKNG